MAYGSSPATTLPTPAATRPASGPEAIARGLTKRHFAMQSERPGFLADIDLLSMDPLLRGLLFTDGTVTRTLEVQGLAPVTVEVVSQERAPARGRTASNLNVPGGADSIRRRVTIGVGSPSVPTIWAQSHIVPARLPDGFLGVLGDSPDGIGESLQQVQLESWRELLWFGLDTPPAWAETAKPRAELLRRDYRVIADGRPAMLISESFAIERRSGVYRLC